MKLRLIIRRSIIKAQSYIRRRLRSLAAYIWRRLLWRTTFIAVIGSVGKTTSKELLANVLSVKHGVHKTAGNRNLRRYGGIEESLLMTRPRHRFAIIEIGTTGPGEMENAAALVAPNIVLFLDVKNIHSESFASNEEVLGEKSTVFKHMKAPRLAIVNTDNRYISSLTLPTECARVSFGSQGDNDYQLLDVDSHGLTGIELAVKLKDGSHTKFRSPLVGKHWSQSILGVVATSHQCGASQPDIASAMDQSRPLKGRMQPVSLLKSGSVFLRDEYNGSYLSLMMGLDTLAEISDHRKILVLSDIRGLRFRDRRRARKLGEIAAQYADAAIFIGPHAFRAKQSALETGLSEDVVFSCNTMIDAHTVLSNILKKGDLVYVKGKNHQHLERIFLNKIGDVMCKLDYCTLAITCDTCSKVGFDVDAMMAKNTSPILPNFAAQSMREL